MLRARATAATAGYAAHVSKAFTKEDADVPEAPMRKRGVPVPEPNVVTPRGLRELRVRFLNVWRLLDVGEMLRVRCAVLRERAGQRRLLLLEAVLLLFVVELNEDLPGLHAIAEVGEDAADRAVGFG